MELCVDRVTKQYKNKIAVDRMSFSLTPGVTGLLGANGAGKTTLMRIISGVLMPDSGEITFDGMSVMSEQYRDVLGYLPQDFGYYPEFTAMDFLLYFAALKGIEKKRAHTRAEELLEVVGLKDEMRKKIKTFSGGMKQRVGIAQALLNRPKILVVDEPTAGLDRRERAWFGALISDIGKENVVLLLTHITSDLEHIANRLLVMQSGQLIWQGDWNENGPDLEEFYLSMLEKGAPENV